MKNFDMKEKQENLEPRVNDLISVHNKIQDRENYQES